MSLLLADIGGTTTRCALGSAEGLGEVASFRNDEHGSVEQVLTAFLTLRKARPRTALLAVAAPLRDADEVQMMNRAWHFSRAGLRNALGLSSLDLLNDFAALAWALPELGPADLTQLGGGVPVERAPKIVLGPGTGLGVASLVPVTEGWQALPGEGGHVSMAAQDEREEAIVRAARERFGHCSAERLLSGAGLSFLHETLHGGASRTAEQIGTDLLAGEARAVETFACFCRFLATVAADAALTLGAFGGVYVAGGIVPRYIDALRAAGFRERFEAKGRYRDYLRAIPTWVVTAKHPALRGLLARARAQRLI